MFTFTSNQLAIKPYYTPLTLQDEELVSISEQPKQNLFFASPSSVIATSNDLKYDVLHYVIEGQKIHKSLLELDLGIAEIKEFIERYKKLAALDALFGLISDFSNDQMKTFDEEIKRREFFK